MGNNYTKCYTRLQKPNGDYWTCYKKQGHHLAKGRENRRHVDNKQSPGHRWEDDTKCDVEGCLVQPDQFDPRHAYGNETYCDDHWVEISEQRAELARRGIYGP